MAGKATTKATSTLNWRTRKKIEEAAVERYLQEHKLGQYASAQTMGTSAPATTTYSQADNPDQQLKKAPSRHESGMPTIPEVEHNLTQLSELIYAGVYNTDNEERRQLYEIAGIQHRQLTRTLTRALSE